MNKLLRFLIKLTLVIIFSILIIMGVIGAFIYFYQDSMIYTQSTFPPGKYFDVPQNYETVVFTTQEGYKYKCWFIKTDNYENAPTLMYILGNGSYKELYIRTYNFYAYYLDINVFACSNRGSGDYEGKPSEKLLYKDNDMFIEYLAKRVGKNPLYIHGRSMGGAVALETAINHQDKLCGLILENTFLSILRIAEEVHPFLAYFVIGLTFLIKTKMDNESKITKFLKPTLFLISRKDQVVNPKHMDTLYDLSRSYNKQKFENPNANHHNVEAGMYEELINKYKSFINATKDQCIYNKAEKEKSENSEQTKIKNTSS